MNPPGTSGYRALREGAAWLDLSARGKLLARGEDRARLLHAMTTNHVEGLLPGQGCYAFFLNAQGRVLGDANVLCLADHLLLDTEPETVRRLHDHLETHIIADDVTLEDATGAMCAIGIEGPRAEDVLSGMGAPLPPEEPCAHVAWQKRLVARLSFTGERGLRIFAPMTQRSELVQSLEAASPEEARVVRLEHGLPRYGEDITEHHLVQETQLLRAMHFHKGCYLGQEIVERVRSRGHVNRLLVRLSIESERAPERDAPVFSADVQIGSVTSAAFSPSLGNVVGLAYVRADQARKGTPIRVGDTRGEIADSRPG
jgi:folate-binding protein YgfZ